ncbi:MAG: methyltransferase domain-containing protein [Halofilum sp. (in: g-proteobacteria)]
MIKNVVTWLVGVWVAAAAAAESWSARSPGAPYVPTPDRIVEEMLDLAEVDPSDYVMDLGSGDGRIVIQAVQRGAAGQGVERNRSLVHDARLNAQRAGIGDRVAFVDEDLFATNLSRASVVTMYLLPDQNARLRPKLLEQLRPGTRIVSHGFEIGLWEPDKKVEVELGPGNMRLVNLWIVPADVRGRWQWLLDGRRFTWQVSQDFQKLDSMLDADGITIALENVELRGRTLAFAAEDDGLRYTFSGRVGDGQIEGIAHASGGAQPRVIAWHAVLQA